MRSDEDLAAWVDLNVDTGYHPVGSCMMGPDWKAVRGPLRIALTEGAKTVLTTAGVRKGLGGGGGGAVVDFELRVHRLAGLRIADASVFPTIPNGNTQVGDTQVEDTTA